jgi:serine/threonine protein kinase
VSGHCVALTDVYHSVAQLAGLCSEAVSAVVHDQVGLLNLEVLLGKPPLSYDDTVTLEDRLHLHDYLDDEESPHAELSDVDRAFVRECTNVRPLERLRLAEVVQTPWIKEYLAWRDDWRPGQ